MKIMDKLMGKVMGEMAKQVVSNGDFEKNEDKYMGNSGNNAEIKDKKEKLVSYFIEGLRKKATYFAVAVEIRGYEKTEIIVNPSTNILKKLANWINVYDENLVYAADKRIRIVGYTYGNDLYEIIGELEQVGIGKQ